VLTVNKQTKQTPLKRPRVKRITAAQKREIEATLLKHGIKPVPGELSMSRSSADKVLEIFKLFESL
jgi:hypothetical protein